MTEINITASGYLDTENASKYIGLSVKTMAKMRCEGRSPKYIKKGRIFYRKEALDEWLKEEGEYKSTTEEQIKRGRQK